MEKSKQQQAHARFAVIFSDNFYIQTVNHILKFLVTLICLYPLNTPYWAWVGIGGRVNALYIVMSLKCLLIFRLKKKILTNSETLIQASFDYCLSKYEFSEFRSKYLASPTITRNPSTNMKKLGNPLPPYCSNRTTPARAFAFW